MLLDDFTGRCEYEAEIAGRNKPDVWSMVSRPFPSVLGWKCVEHTATTRSVSGYNESDSAVALHSSLDIR